MFGIIDRFIRWGTNPDEVNAQDMPAGYTPTNYTPVQVSSEGNDKVSAHLRGINTALGSSGGGNHPYTSKIANYLAVNTDDVIDCNGTFTVTLFTAVGNTGKEMNIKNSGTGVITVQPNGAETIDGVNTQTLLATNSLRICSNGTNWLII